MGGDNHTSGRLSGRFPRNQCKMKKHKSYDRYLKDELFEFRAVSLKGLYITGNPTLFDFMITIRNHPKLKDKLLTDSLLRITAVTRRPRDVIKSFLGWMDKFSENAPKDVESDYEFLCDERNQSIISNLLLLALDLTTEKELRKGQFGKLSPAQYKVMDMIYSKAYTRVETAKKMKISIIEVRKRITESINLLKQA